MPENHIQMAELRLKQSVLDTYGLPDIGYPIPMKVIEMGRGAGELGLSSLLYYLHRSNDQTEALRTDIDAAIDRLAELLTPDIAAHPVTASAKEWWIETGRVSLDSPVITLERGQRLIAVIGSRDDGTLCAASYWPLDFKSAEVLIDLSRKPTDGKVCFRASNWEYAIDCALGMGQVYAQQRDESRLSYYEFGIAEHASLHAPKTMRNANFVAIELGVHHLHTQDIEVDYGGEDDVPIQQHRERSPSR